MISGFRKLSYHIKNDTIISIVQISYRLTLMFGGTEIPPQTTTLDKCAPPTVHCLLALNNILRPHLENIWVGDLWTFLQVVPHSYQGKEGAFEGPQCNRILNYVEDILKPLLISLGEKGVHF
jgi:hypothetical protein